MPESTLAVEHLFSLTATTGKAAVVGGPAGNRIIVPISGGSFEGPKMRGVVIEGASADWVVVRPDGSMKLDVRVTLETDDGAQFYMSYSGFGTRTDSGSALRSAPYFETNAERYAWLNSVQGVGIGTSSAAGVEYEVYALTV
jgi:hypothetical protein